jgi:hypothetical protein
MSRDSTANKMTVFILDCRFSFPGRDKFLFRHSHDIASDCHAASYRVKTRGKVAVCEVGLSPGLVQSWG